MAQFRLSQPGLIAEAGPNHKESNGEQAADHLLADLQPPLAVVVMMITTQSEMTEEN